ATLAAWSGGRLGWAIQMLAQPEAIAHRDEQLESLLALPQQGVSAGLRWAEQRAKEYRSGEQATVFAWLDLWQSWWRDVLLVAAGCPESVINLDRQEHLAQAARRYDAHQAYTMVAKINQAVQQLRENGNPQLVLESIVLQLPRGG
ncbi:MAG: DNA polymerase III subunit delta', partial [Chloroflexia bacterium]|nr:DNA polymerase III subunit delta' [Chloroflexia bacterium]